MNRSITVMLTALAPIAWGTTYLVTTALLPAGHPLFAGLMRALPAGLLAIAGRSSLAASYRRAAQEWLRARL